MKQIYGMKNFTDSFKRRVEVILNARKAFHLIPVYTNVYRIPERIHGYSDNLFVVFNTRKQRYEIHSVANGPGMNSKELDIPFDELDIRAVYHLWEHDIRVHGREIFRRIEEQEERFERQKKRRFQNWVRDVASETRLAFAREAWGDGGKLLFQGSGVKQIENEKP